MQITIAETFGFKDEFVALGIRGKTIHVKQNISSDGSTYYDLQVELRNDGDVGSIFGGATLYRNDSIIASWDSNGNKTSAGKIITMSSTEPVRAQTDDGEIVNLNFLNDTNSDFLKAIVSFEIPIFSGSSIIDEHSRSYYYQGGFTNTTYATYIRKSHDIHDTNYYRLGLHNESYDISILSTFDVRFTFVGDSGRVVYVKNECFSSSGFNMSELGNIVLTTGYDEVSLTVGVDGQYFPSVSFCYINNGTENWSITSGSTEEKEVITKNGTYAFKISTGDYENSKTYTVDLNNTITLQVFGDFLVANVTGMNRDGTPITFYKNDSLIGVQNLLNRIAQISFDRSEGAYYAELPAYLTFIPSMKSNILIARNIFNPILYIDNENNLCVDEDENVNTYNVYLNDRLIETIENN